MRVINVRSDSYFLCAEPVSEPELTVLPSSSDVSEGNSMTLICSVQRGSPPINFTWYHTNSEHPLASQTSNKLKESHNISDVRGEHAGWYYCASSNPASEPRKSELVRIRGGGFTFRWQPAVVRTRS